MRTTTKTFLLILFVSIFLLLPVSGLTISPLKITDGTTIIYVDSPVQTRVLITGEGIFSDIDIVDAGTRVPVIFTVSPGARGYVLFNGGTNATGSVTISQSIKLNINGGSLAQTPNPTQEEVTPTITETTEEQPDLMPSRTGITLMVGMYYALVAAILIVFGYLFWRYALH